ncbi:MAG: serine--tRNA ligase [Patescibacteria group bacterium]
MIDIKFLRDNPDLITAASQAKNRLVDVKAILDLDSQKRALQAEVDSLRQGRGDKLLSEADRIEAKAKKELLKDKEQALKQLSDQLNQILLTIPNPARPDVKVGKTENDNEVLRQVGDKPNFSFAPQDYLTLAQKHDLIDMTRAAKVSGSRFGYLKNQAVLLEFALVQYGLSVVLKNGFVPVVPPVLISEKAMQAMGYLENGGEEETYHLKEQQLYLVGTSEQSIGPMHMDEVLEIGDLPKRYVGFSSCFRSEAGSYGKDTKGILRVHQFDKLEMVVFTKPEDSDQEHDKLLSLEEELMQGLKLPYQVIKMCTADLGDPAARKYDIETWIPSEGKYRETHSCSTTTDFQARRLNIRYKTTAGKPEFVHMLNGTVFAIGRTLIAILENYQQADGSITIPEVLRPYMSGVTKIG